MRRSILLCFLAVVFLGLGCSKDNENSTEVNIRLENISNLDYTEITINGGSGNFTYEDLNSGEVSEYQVFEYAYPYAYVELKIGEEVFIIQPIDFVGEEQVTNGSYTYEIGVNNQFTNAYDRLTIDLEED